MISKCPNKMWHYSLKGCSAPVMVGSDETHWGLATLQLYAEAGKAN